MGISNGGLSLSGGMASGMFTPNAGKENPEKNLRAFTWPSVESHSGMSFLHRWQFPESCDNKKFVLFQFPRRGTWPGQIKQAGADTRNIGAIYTALSVYIHWAIHYDRILVVEDQDWDITNCTAKDHTCYFMPHSLCRIQSLNLDEKDVYTLHDGASWAMTEQQQEAKVWRLGPFFYPSNVGTKKKSQTNQKKKNQKQTKNQQKKKPKNQKPTKTDLCSKRNNPRSGPEQQYSSSFVYDRTRTVSLWLVLLRLET